VVHSRALRSVVAGRASGGGGKCHRSLRLTSLDISSVTFDRTTKSEAGFPVTVASAISRIFFSGQARDLFLRDGKAMSIYWNLYYIRCRCPGSGKWMELEFAGGLFGTSLIGLEIVIKIVLG